MWKIIEADQPFRRVEMAAEGASELFAEHPYERAIIEAAAMGASSEMVPRSATVW